MDKNYISSFVARDVSSLFMSFCGLRHKTEKKLKHKRSLPTPPQCRYTGTRVAKGWSEVTCTTQVVMRNRERAL